MEELRELAFIEGIAAHRRNKEHYISFLIKRRGIFFKYNKLF